MAVTIKDVAREAKVSVATVSRALNGSASVTVETRRLIDAVAKRLSYVPHATARSLITRRTETVGALLPDLYGEFYSELIRGIDLAARSRGLHLLVSSSHGSATEAAAALRAMQGRVDGLLIMSPHVDGEFLRNYLPGSLPTVLMNSPATSTRYSTLNIDNYGGAFAMTQHLIRCGYRKIALIGGPDGNFDASERLRGYRDAVAQSGEPIESNTYGGDFTEESGYYASRQMLAMRNRPRAIFASNDMMAVGALFALNEAGVRVPEDIALVGFDDIPIAPFVSPPLSTVRVRIANLGRSALEELATQLEEHDTTPSPLRTFPCEIVVRASCGANAFARTHKNTKIA
ncbi:MAG: LacI family DNA-binding transcriptional regulator [Rudaea sp.]